VQNRAYYSTHLKFCLVHVEITPFKYKLAILLSYSIVHVKSSLMLLVPVVVDRAVNASKI
jgi:hypothetical protein